MNTVSELLISSFGRHLSSDAIFDNGTVTYAQLTHNAACIASALERSGVGKGDPVGIYLNRSKEYITAMVSCLIFGYCAVLLDIEYPEDRISYMLEDSKAKTIIDAAFFEKAISDNIPSDYCDITPDTNALVVYTSGSTGRPKGVLHDQESTCNAILRFMSALDYNENDIYGSTAPYTFIAVGTDVLYPLCAGALLHVVPRDVVKLPGTFSQYISDHKITAANIPPKILKVFKKTGSSLRIATTGSEKVSGIAPEEFRIFNLYGMSEGFPSVSIFEIDKAYETTPIGNGDGSLGIYLLDDDGNETDEGEICISGHLFSGYLNLEEQTSKVLVPNPFSFRDGHRMMFHTNDIGRRLPDGNIVYVNRKDWMIKINGYRVEPGEVESAIKSVPQIFDCVVKAFVRENGSQYIAAYYVEKQPVSADDIRTAITSLMPYYMIPSYFVRLESLPVNNNGKLDHKALTEPETASMATNYVKPSCELESLICTAMAEILSLKKVGIKDDFFTLGANYEEAKFIADRFADMGADENLIYKYRTAENIAAALAGGRKGNPETENALALSIPQKLTAAQQYYIDYQLLFPGSKLSNNCVSVDIPINKISVTDLKVLLEDSFRHHPALCTMIIFDENGDLIQQYFSDIIMPVECFECTEEEYENSIKDTRARKLPVFGKLLYYCTIHTTDSYHHVFFDIHRCICDRQGILNLLKSTADLAYGKIPSADYYYVYLNRMDYERGRNLESKNTCLIRSFLNDSSCASTPHKDHDNNSMTRATLIREAGRSVDEYVRAFSAHHTPVELLLIAAGMLALGRYNNADKISVSWLFNGRSESWEKSAVGAMSEAIPVCAVLSDYDSLISLIKSVHEQCNDGVEFARYLGYFGADPGNTELLEIEYADRSQTPDEAMHRIGARMRQNDSRSNQFRILAVSGDENNPLTFKFAYNEACYDRESVEEFADLFVSAFDICCFGTLSQWKASDSSR